MPIFVEVWLGNSMGRWVDEFRVPKIVKRVFWINLDIPLDEIFSLRYDRVGKFRQLQHI